MELDERTKAAIRGAIREVDPAQVARTRRLTPAQRFAKMASMIEWAERMNVRQLRSKRPELSESEALRIVRSQQ
jgi:hypothetical protein